MRTILSVLVLGLLLVGCGKKNSPEGGGGPAVTATCEEMSLFRTEPIASIEKDNLSTVLKVTNKRATAITLTHITYTAYAGKHPGEHVDKDLEQAVNAGSSTNLRLDSSFLWPNDAGFSGGRGRIEGTLYYKNANDKPLTLALDLQTDLKVQGK